MSRATGATELPVLLPMRDSAQPGEWGLATPLSLLRSARLLGALVALAVLSAAAAVAASPEARPSVLSLLVKWAPLIFSGFLFNLLVSIASMAIGTAAGLLLGLAQVSLHAPVRGFAWSVTQFFRNAPWLVLLFFAMFLLPFELSVGGWIVPFPAWLKAIIGLSLPVLANVSEIVRGGVSSIPIGQWESAESLAFTRRQTIWRIVLPQAIKRMLPPWMNLYAILTMATTLISVVGIQDSMTLTRGALVAEGRTDLYLPIYFMLLALFFAYCYPIARYTQILERRFAVKA
jgi:polar amino acid transport system permease protein